MTTLNTVQLKIFNLLIFVKKALLLIIVEEEFRFLEHKQLKNKQHPKLLPVNH